MRAHAHVRTRGRAGGKGGAGVAGEKGPASLHSPRLPSMASHGCTVERVLQLGDVSRAAELHGIMDQYLADDATIALLC